MNGFTPTNQLEITCVQQLSRAAIGFLWNMKTQLDPGQVAIIKTIYHNLKKGQIEGEQTITYRLSNTTLGSLGYGRLYSKGGFETLEKQCRGTICKDYYHDLDIVNCHPVLITQLANNYKQQLPTLQLYVKDREKVLSNISLNKEEAKDEVLKALYCGKTENDITKTITTEILSFCKYLSTISKYKELYTFLTNQKAKNLYGTFLSHIIQTEERYCMLAMKAYLETLNIKVDVLCYDGVMIRKGEYIIDNNLLRGISNAIKESTGYIVKIKEKPFIFFEIPNIDDTEEVAPGLTRGKYNKYVEEWHKNHFYYKPTNQIAEVDDNGVVHLYDLKHAAELYRTTWIHIRSDKFADYIPLMNVWNNDLNKRIINKMSYIEKGEGIYTMPFNFIYEKHELNEEKKAYHIELFETLLRVNCGNDTVLMDYVRKYIVHLLKHPFDLPGVALIISGDKGIGKDTLINFIMECVIGDDKSQNYTDNKQFFEKHDNGKQGKFLIKLEEASRGNCLENSAVLKATITAKALTFNPKGSKAYTFENYGRYIFTTNLTNPVEVSNGERRFVIIRASSKMKGNLTFFNTIYKDLFTFEAGRSVADYLLQIDITNFSIRKLPVNIYQDAVIESEKSDIQLFIEQWGGEELQMAELYSQYRSFCSGLDLAYAANSISLGRRLPPFIADGIIIKRNGLNKQAFYSKKEKIVPKCLLDI